MWLRDFLYPNSVQKYEKHIFKYMESWSNSPVEPFSNQIFEFLIIDRTLLAIITLFHFSMYVLLEFLALEDKPGFKF